MDCHGLYEPDARDLADIIKSGEGETPYLYNAIDSLENEFEKSVLNEALTRRRLGL